MFLGIFHYLERLNLSDPAPGQFLVMLDQKDYLQPSFNKETLSTNNINFVFVKILCAVVELTTIRHFVYYPTYSIKYLINITNIQIIFKIIEITCSPHVHSLSSVIS